jgi:glutamyl-Q tRNA(Asp) synthetase
MKSGCGLCGCGVIAHHAAVLSRVRRISAAAGLAGLEHVLMTRSFTNRVFRFAPSSNGYLHLGHAYSALLNFELAKMTGGRFLLRIEDIDIERCPREFEEAIYEDLGWLGLSWETPVRRQSEHFSEYASALAKLSAQGLTYPCFCTRAEIMSAVATRAGWPLDPDGSPLYPGTCKQLSRKEKERRLASGEPRALRIDMGAAIGKCACPLAWREMNSCWQARDVPASPAAWGDVTLSRKDIPASYHIAVVVDDALQGVTDVVRGDDLFMATSLHRLLQALLDLPVPGYHHHSLLRDPAGRKLSKSSKAKPLRALRLEGLSPAAVRKSLSPELILAGTP